LAIQTDEEVSVAFTAIQVAERCRLEAYAMVTNDSQRYSTLIGQPSGWCVVTEKGFWKMSFHGQHEQSLLRDRLQNGQKVILTVGIVADPRVSLMPDNHAAEKLAIVTAHAKMHATSWIYL